MIFQTLDDKKECVAVFCEDELFYKQLPDNLSRTWKYAPYLENLDIKYASLYCIGRSLDEVCPEELKSRWESINDKMRAFLTSFSESKISLYDNCFFDMVPASFLKEYCTVKNQITEHVFQNYEKPMNYSFLLELTKVLEEIKYQKLNLNFRKLDKHLGSPQARNYLKKISSGASYISYDINGTKTGRLTTTKNSFPVLTLNKKYRGTIEPNNDCFIELDFNAAELRTLLAISGKEQPEGDIHAWNAKNVYNGTVTREQAKKRIFAWLYNPDSKDQLSNDAYDRDSIVNKFWDGTKIHTIFNRSIESDKYHALNYIIQSTASDLFLRRVVEVHKALKDKKSNIAFCVHDSLVIDFSQDERSLFNEILEIFSRTEFGDFKVNVSIGRDYSDMKEIM